MKRAKPYGTHKYHAIRAVVDGITFPSKAEAARYEALKLEYARGAITNLTLHPRWTLEVNGVKVCVYEADFSYHRNGVEVVEDVKGVRTRIFALKKKLLRAVHGVEVLEVDKRGNVKPARKPRAQRPRKAAKR